jgi:murein DD-endopeptidase MepM/ murein hydrolase activator NlpD
MQSLAWDGDWPITQGYQPNPNLPGCHLGVDIGMPIGTRLFALGDGTVGKIGIGMLGVDMDSGGRYFYLHVVQCLVSLGTRVAAGMAVAISGAIVVDPRFPISGPHLHFEVQTAGFQLPGIPSAPGASLDPIPILEEAMTPGELALLYETRDKVNEMWNLLRDGIHNQTNPRWIFNELEAIRLIKIGAALTPAQAAQLTHIEAMLTSGLKGI